MKKKKFVFTIVLLASVGLTPGWAQEAVSPTGGDASSSGGSISYSMGYTAYTTASGAGGSVTSGLLHPIETFVLSTKKRTVALDCEAYPNPVGSSVTLRVTKGALPNYSFQLCDLLGRVLEAQPLQGPVTTISMAHLPAAAYVLTVRKGKEQVQAFKIIKR